MKKIALPSDWRARFKTAALLCAAASVVLAVLFLFSCGDRNARGFCRPGPVSQSRPRGVPAPGG